MAKRRVVLATDARRAILTDMLPFEVPPTFSNRGFYRFLAEHNVVIKNRQVRWTAKDDSLDFFMRLLFGAEKSAAIESRVEKAWGSQKSVRSLSLRNCDFSTAPFHFSVSHKEGGRALSVPHPRNQVEMAAFFAKYSALILYYSGRSAFSIRKPVSIAKFAYFNDKLHEQRLDSALGVEEDEKEYEQLGSYFVYRRFRNIHRFFESPDYLRCERKFQHLTQVDITKCFDSIYTHSVVWAVLGKRQTKFSLRESNTTFAGIFDSVMQKLNHKETNGILIGPEFSRVFAEIILQAVDTQLEMALHEQGILHERDYELFRYVDDYFLFYSKAVHKEAILDQLQQCLRGYKLSVNPGKSNDYSRPIITELTIAKDRVGSLLTEEISPTVEKLEGVPGAEEDARLVCYIRTDRLIVRYKTVVRESGVEYATILNYTLAILENKLEQILRAFGRSSKALRDQDRVAKSILATLEFAFFVFAASPKVNHSVRLCRLIATSVDFMRKSRLPYDLKHLVLRYVHDSIMEELEKNAMTIHREVESLYLLVALAHIGKEYWLPETVLASHFIIKPDAAGHYTRSAFLGHFAITVLLTYMREKRQYSKLRAFIVEHALKKLAYMRAHCPNDSEATLLFLDLATCPYFAASDVEQIGKLFGLEAAEVTRLRRMRRQWFTAWGDDFSLSRELEAKRSREVY